MFEKTEPGSFLIRFFWIQFFYQLLLCNLNSKNNFLRFFLHWVLWGTISVILIKNFSIVKIFLEEWVNIRILMFSKVPYGYLLSFSWCKYFKGSRKYKFDFFQISDVKNQFWNLKTNEYLTILKGMFHLCCIAKWISILQYRSQRQNLTPYSRDFDFPKVDKNNKKFNLRAISLVENFIIYC